MHDTHPSPEPQLEVEPFVLQETYPPSEHFILAEHAGKAVVEKTMTNEKAMLKKTSDETINLTFLFITHIF